MSEISILQAAINRVHRMVLLVAGRGRTTTSVNDDGPVRMVQGKLGPNQIRDNIPMPQQYGFASNPPIGSDFILSAIAGDTSNSCIVATNHQKWILKTLGDGVVALYDMFGNKIVLDDDGISLIDFSGNSLVMNASGVKVTTGQTYEVDAANIRLHATQNLKYDVGGNGTAFTSNTRTDYSIGSTGSTQPLHPPEIP